MCPHLHALIFFKRDVYIQKLLIYIKHKISPFQILFSCINLPSDTGRFLNSVEARKFLIIAWSRWRHPVRKHQLITTLHALRGNARACVLTEPLWSVPHNLYVPYASIYMLAFGLSDGQIGLLTSIGLLVQMFWTVLGGAITDKLGRKRTTLIFDLASWTIPCLILALAQNFAWFLAAAIINAGWRVTLNSWQCLLVEDTEPDLLVDVYSWVYISGLVAAFVSPITGRLIATFTLIPTIRGVYLLAMVIMTAKFFILNGMATETRQGVERMEATRHESLVSLLRGFWPVLKQLLNTPATLFTAGMMVILQITTMITNTFWPILVTEKLGIPAEHLPLFHFARSLTMLAIFFTIMPKLRSLKMRGPLMVGFSGLVLMHILLLMTPQKHYALLLLTIVLEGCSVPVATTLIDKMQVLTVDRKERARIMAILYACVIVCTSPFGWLAGQLSEINRGLPFALNLALLSGGVLLAYRLRE